MGHGPSRRAAGESLKPLYEGGRADLSQAPLVRHDLLPPSYAFGAIQTTRGCPLRCHFCSVTAFNGARYRERPVADVVREFRLTRERLVFVVDDNLIGTTPRNSVARRSFFAPSRRRSWASAGSPRPPSTSPTMRSSFVWRPKRAVSASLSALSRPRRKDSSRWESASTFGKIETSPPPCAASSGTASWSWAPS